MYKRQIGILSKFISVEISDYIRPSRLFGAYRTNTDFFFHFFFAAITVVELEFILTISGADPHEAKSVQD